MPPRSFFLPRLVLGFAASQRRTIQRGATMPTTPKKTMEGTAKQVNWSNHPPYHFRDRERRKGRGPRVHGLFEVSSRGVFHPIGWTKRSLSGRPAVSTLAASRRHLGGLKEVTRAERSGSEYQPDPRRTVNSCSTRLKRVSKWRRRRRLSHTIQTTTWIIPSSDHHILSVGHGLFPPRSLVDLRILPRA